MPGAFYRNKRRVLIEYFLTGLQSKERKSRGHYSFENEQIPFIFKYRELFIAWSMSHWDRDLQSALR
jgi:hypothetical protein